MSEQDTEEPEEKPVDHIVNSLYAWGSSEDGFEDAMDLALQNLNVAKSDCPIELTVTRARGEVSIRMGGNVLDSGYGATEDSEVIDFGVLPEVEWDDLDSDGFEEYIEENVTWLRKDGEPQWNTEAGDFSVGEKPDDWDDE